MSGAERRTGAPDVVTYVAPGLGPDAVRRAEAAHARYVAQARTGAPRTVTAAVRSPVVPTVREKWAAATVAMARADRAIECRRQADAGQALARRYGYR